MFVPYTMLDTIANVLCSIPIQAKCMLCGLIIRSNPSHDLAYVGQHDLRIKKLMKVRHICYYWDLSVVQVVKNIHSKIPK